MAGMPAKQMAAHLQICVRNVYYVIQRYKMSGTVLVKKTNGRPKNEVNPNCKARIKAEWQKFQCGSVKLHKILESKGYGVSQYKIQQVMDEFQLSAPYPKRRGQRKYCS